MIRFACLMSLAALALAALASPTRSQTEEPQPRTPSLPRPTRLRIAVTGELVPTFHAQFSLN